MNYRHAFHAGNFADLAKHAALGLLLDRLFEDRAPILAVDTHAGAGLYALDDDRARKSGEAEAGILRLMADTAAPVAFDGLKGAVRALNKGGPARLYPGSPLLIAERLRPGDGYVGAELHDEDFALLRDALARFRGHAEARRADGYDLAASVAEQERRRLLVLVDPPFERPDDYDRAVAVARALLRRKSPSMAMIWTPLKDLETFDAFLRGLEKGFSGRVLVAEIRLNRLDNPLRLNGCCLVFLNPPDGLADRLTPPLEWIARRCGGEGAGARTWAVGG